MTAEQFIEINFESDYNEFRRKAVAVMMDAFAFFKVEEFRALQFAPLKKSIIEHLSMVTDKGIVGISIHTLLEGIELKSQEEILKAVASLKELAIRNDRVAKETLGKAYLFFRDLTFNPYEHNTAVHSATIGNEGERVRQLSENTQAAN